MDTIKWYTGDDIYILTILNNSFAFNAAFSQELRMNNNNASTLFPKIALAMEDEHLYVQVRENDGFLLRRNMEHGTAILDTTESNIVREKFGDKIIGEWRFKKTDDYYKGTKAADIPPFTIVK